MRPVLLQLQPKPLPGVAGGLGVGNKKEARPPVGL